MTLRLVPVAVVLAAACALFPAPARAQARTWPAEQPPRPLAARQVRFPPFEIRTLPNGLQVVVVMHHEQPVVSIRLIVRAGCAQDPTGLPGVANMVASLVDQGTASRSGQQIAETIDSVGGDLEVGAGTDLSFARVTVMTDSVDLGLDLLSDVVRHPVFAPEELERQRQQIRSSLKVSYEDPDYIATVVAERLIYGFHPYGFPGNGTPASVGRITRDDLVSFHGRYFAPNNSLVAIVGDVTAAEAFERAERAFGAWARRDVPPVVPGDAPEPTRRIVVVDKPDAVQTEIRVGHLGIPRKSPDYMAMDLAVKILGGEGSNRLQQVLRTERGLTYGASTDLDAYKQTGDVIADTDTRSSATAEVLRIIVDEFARLQREDVREAELTDAKAYLAGSFPLSIETPDAIASSVLNALFYELPLDELQTFRERVGAVGVGDIQRVTRAYLRPDRLSMVMVGDAKAFVDQLRRLGFRNIEIVPLAELDLSAPDFRRPSSSTAPPSTPAGSAEPAPPPASGAQVGATDEWRAAKAVMLRAAEAAGGPAKLAGIKTVSALAYTVLLTPQGPVQAGTRTYIEYPGRFRVDAAVPGGDIVQTYADGRAWMKDPNGVRDAPDGMRKQFRASVQRDLIPLLVSATSDKLTGRRLADEKGTGDRLLQVVELRSEQMTPVRVFVDASTGRIEHLAYEETGPRGPELTTEHFDDYRSIDGLWVPFKTVVRRDGRPLLERTLSLFLYNVALPPRVFEKPQ